MSDDEPMICGRCDQAHARCSGHNRQGGPCGRHRLAGQRVCDYHGGKTPVVLAAAARRLAQREAAAAVETFGLPRSVDPHEALLEELHRSAGAVAWLDLVVGGLEREDVVWGKTRTRTDGDDRGVTHEAGVSVWVRLWSEQRKHYLDVAKACVAAGIAELRLQLEQDKARMVAAAVSAGLDAIEASPAEREVFTRVLLAQLRVADVASGEVLS